MEDKLPKKKASSLFVTMCLVLSIFAVMSITFTTFNVKAELYWSDEANRTVDDTRWIENEVIIVQDGDLNITSTGELIFGNNVTLKIVCDTPGEFGINIEAGGKFIVNSTNSDTIITYGSIYPSNTYPFLNSGTIDFQGATVDRVYGNPSDKTNTGGIRNLPGSTCNLTNCNIMDGDTHSLYIEGDSKECEMNLAGTTIGQSDTGALNGTGIWIKGNSHVTIDNVTVGKTIDSGIKCVDAGYVVIQNGSVIQETGTVGLFISNSSVIVQDSFIRYNTGDGIWLENSDSVINKTKIHDNSGDGIVCVADANPTIMGLETNISWNGGNGIYSDGAFPKVNGIRVEHNYADGILVKNSYNSGSVVCGITNSKICYNYGSGISLNSTDIEVDHNEIWENGLASIYRDDMNPFSKNDANLQFNSANSDRTVTRLATPDDIARLKEIYGVYEEGANYTIIIDGFETGVVPPTEEEWASMENSLTIVEDLISDKQLSNYTDYSLSPYFPPIGLQDG